MDIRDLWTIKLFYLIEVTSVTLSVEWLGLIAEDMKVQDEVFDVHGNV